MSAHDEPQRDLGAEEPRAAEAGEVRTPLTPPLPSSDRVSGEEVASGAGPVSGAGAANEPAPFGGALGRSVRAGLSGEAVSGRGVLEAIGGWRGIAETLVPGVLFLALYTFTRDARISAIAPAALTTILMVIRLLRREPLVSVISGAAGVAVAVAATLVTGRGADYYLPGFITNIAWGGALLLSALVGWPLIGLVLGALRGDLTGWRKSRPLKRAATWLTLVWASLFIARLAVQVPLYFAAREDDGSATDALGIARLVMGVPLFALVVILTWFVLSRLAPSSDDSANNPETTPGQNTPMA
ncbi:DUF3159 domain-containing protein [Leucobacter sp. USHLN153]|uniref:DUF3159 domain-containing protein n=1 Tax=Leucobacter sp. USHLN153 TaxID=3081268 RepID=UPI00301A54D3